MAEIYGTTNIPGDSVEVRAGGTVAISAAFETTLGLVGGMDTSNGSASTGTVKTVESSADAGNLFGEDSELKEQVDLAYANGAGTIYAIGVSETETTENFSSTTGDSLGNAPVFDPQVHPDHSITAQDDTGTSMTVNIVYDSPSTPADSDTINLNPITGAWEADTSDTYDITYTYGDYSSAITDVVKKVPRFVTVLSEASSHANDLLTELNNYDTDFDFMHGVVGATPEVSASGYSDSLDDRRLSVVAPARGFTDEAESNMQRTLGAVGGRQSGKALGDSTTYESLAGLHSLNTQYTNSELGTLVDSQVLPIRQAGEIQVIKDMTTSTDTRFERIYISEIVDEATEISHNISQDFVGEINNSENRTNLEESHRSSYLEMQDDDLLEAFYVSVTKGANDFEADVEIGLDVIGIMDTIDVRVTVGDVVTNQGAA
jgi:hypothetical protein